jgi:hypothetical protein
MSKNAKIKSEEVFNPIKSMIEFETFALSLKPKKGIKFKSYGSRLDNEMFPNCLVKFLRRIRK